MMNENRTEQNRTEVVQPPIAGYPPPYGYYPQADEISLIDFWQVLVKRKLIVFGLTAIATVGAVIYALLSPPVYKAEAFLLPPLESHIQALNIQRIQDVQDVQDVTIDSIYSMFKNNLSARSTRRSVFEQMNILERITPERERNINVEAIFDAFSQSLRVSSPEEAGQIITLSMEGGDPVFIAEVVNRVVKEGIAVTTADIISNIKAKVAARTRDLNQEIRLLREKSKKHRMDEIERLKMADALERKKIEDEISALREMEKQKRLDIIVVLQEAAAIAHGLGIKEPIGYELRKISDAISNKSSIVTDLGASNSQLYTRGYEALEAEINSLSKRTTDDPFIPKLRDMQEQLLRLEHNRRVEQLKKRKNDDPFISSLRDMENELARLNSIHIDPESVNVARLDRAAYPSGRRIRPKRKPIVVLGFVLGLMLGVFGAFFSNFLENARNDKKKLENT